MGFVWDLLGGEVGSGLLGTEMDQQGTWGGTPKMHSQKVTKHALGCNSELLTEGNILCLKNVTVPALSDKRRLKIKAELLCLPSNRQCKSS